MIFKHAHTHTMTRTAERGALHVPGQLRLGEEPALGRDGADGKPVEGGRGQLRPSRPEGATATCTSTSTSTFSSSSSSSSSSISNSSSISSSSSTSAPCRALLQVNLHPEYFNRAETASTHYEDSQCPTILITLNRTWPKKDPMN